MTLLTICQRAADRISIPRPTTVIGSTDQTNRQLLALANQEGDELMQEYDWQALTEEQTFVTTATAEQDLAIPSDLNRFIDDSFFNRTTIRKIIGPITPQVWQAIQTLPALNPVYLVFRERRNEFLLTMTPPAGQTIAYEYISKNWARSSAGTPKAEFTSDDDTAFVSEELIVDGLVWRFLRAKGLDYSEEFQTYERSKQQKKGADGGKRMLNLGGANYLYGDTLLGANIPYGNYPG